MRKYLCMTEHQEPGLQNLFIRTSCDTERVVRANTRVSAQQSNSSTTAKPVLDITVSGDTNKTHHNSFSSIFPSPYMVFHGIHTHNAEENMDES